MWAHRHDVIPQDGRIFNVLQNRDVYLRVGLQDRVTRIVEETKQSQSEESQSSEPPTFISGGVFLQLLLGPNTVRIELSMTCSNAAPRLRVAIKLAQRESHPADALPRVSDRVRLPSGNPSEPHQVLRRMPAGR